MDYKEAVVVFENGYCEHLKDAISNRKKIRNDMIGKGEKIESAKLCILGSKAISVVVSVDSKVNSILQTLIYSILIYKLFSNIVISECKNVTSYAIRKYTFAN